MIKMRPHFCERIVDSPYLDSDLQQISSQPSEHGLIDVTAMRKLHLGSAEGDLLLSPGLSLVGAQAL
jgi:hypothetical protein